MGFDIKGALEAGYSQEEIDRHLGVNTKPKKIGFEYAGARESGYSEEEIARHLARETGFDVDAARAQGYNYDEMNRHMLGIEQDYQDDLARQANIEGRGDFARGLSRGIDQAQSAGYGAAALVGSLVGSDSLKEWGMEGYRENQREASLNPGVRWKDADTLGQKVDFAQGTLAELIPSMAEAATGALIGSLAAPGPGTAAGAFGARTILRKGISEVTEQVVKSRIKSGLIKEGGEQAAKAAIRKEVTKDALRRVGGKVGMGAAVLPIEAGSNYADLLDQHGISAPETAMLTGALATSFEFMGGNSRLIDNFLGSIIKRDGNMIKRTARELLENVPAEGLQESAQEVMSILNTVVNTDEKLLSPEHVEGVVESFMAGAVGGSAGGLVTGFRSKPTQEKRVTKPYQAMSQNKEVAELADKENIEALEKAAAGEIIPEPVEEPTPVIPKKEENAEQPPVATTQAVPVERTSTAPEVVDLTAKPATTEQVTEPAPATEEDRRLASAQRIAEAFGVTPEEVLNPQVGLAEQAERTKMDRAARMDRGKRGIPGVEMGAEYVAPVKAEQARKALADKFQKKIDAGKQLAEEYASKYGPDAAEDMLKYDNEGFKEYDPFTGEHQGERPPYKEALDYIKTMGAPDVKQTLKDITPKSSPVFKTQGAALSGIKRAGAVDTHEAVQVDGGWVGRQKEAKPLKEKPKAQGTAYLHDNTPIDFEYTVKESSDLTTSHDESLNVNPAYPSDLQPRDRGRSAMKLQVEGIANKLNPARLGADSSAANGAPIVGPDGSVVESGNGRSIAIRKAYASGAKGAEYKRWLIDNAEQFGLSKSEIAKLKNPVLVRRRTNDIGDVAAFTKKANVADVAKMSATEQAVADAENLDAGDITLFEPSEDGNLNSASNQAFINRFVAKMGAGEQAGYLTADGRANKQLIDRIQAAAFQKAYESQDILSLVAEEADPDIKNILNGLNAAVPGFVKARGLDPDLGGTGAVKSIIDGVAYLKQAKSDYPDIAKTAAKGTSRSRTKAENQVKMAISQMNMFGAAPGMKEAQAIALFLGQNIQKPKRIGEFFKSMAGQLREHLADAPQKNLFGQKEKLTAKKLIDSADRKVQDKYEDKNLDLFSGVKNEKEAGSSRHDKASDQGSKRSGSERASVDNPAKNSATPEKNQEEVISFKKSDIDFELAKNAHRGTSHVPDERAVQVQAGYVRHMEDLYASLSKKANTDEKKAILESEMARYKEGYIKRLNAKLAADSRTMSSMITGPANFPVRSNQKKLDTAMRRNQELLDWQEKAQRAMRRKIHGTEAVQSNDPNAIQKLEKKLEKRVRDQERMKAGNKILRNKKLSDAEKIERLKAEVDISEKAAKELLKPDYAGKQGFASFELSNNNAQIKRLKGRIEKLKSETKEETTEKEYGDIKVVDNAEAKRIQIVFDGKPDAETRKVLKSKGFRWAPSQNAWQRMRTNSARAEADEIAKTYGGQKQNTDPQHISEADAKKIDSAKGTEHYKQKAIERYQQEIKNIEASIKDWESRVYKGNNQVITMGEDDDIQRGQVSRSIGQINEKRRASTIKGMKSNLKDYKDALEVIKSIPADGEISKKDALKIYKAIHDIDLLDEKQSRYSQKFADNLIKIQADKKNRPKTKKEQEAIDNFDPMEVLFGDDVPQHSTKEEGPEIAKWEKEFRRYARKITDAEKDLGREMTQAEQDMLNRDWKEFSRYRGYTEQEIADYQKYQDLYEEGRKLGLPEDEIFGIHVHETAPETFGAPKGITLKDVESAFPGQQVAQNGDTYTVKTKGGLSVTIESVEETSEGRYLANTNNVIAGKYHKGKIQIVKGAGDKYTLSHEAEHWLEDSGVLTGPDKRALDRAARQNGGRAGSEGRARFVEQALMEREKHRGTRIGRIIQKVGDIIDGIVNVFRKTGKGVVREMESGKVFERPGQEAKGGAPQFSAKVKKRFAKDWDLSLSGAKDFVKYLLSNKDWKPGKEDTTVIERHLSLPSHYAKKVPGYGRAYGSALQWMDDKHIFFGNLTNDAEGKSLVKEIDEFRKDRPDEYNEFKGYIIHRDQNEIGYTVKPEESEWGAMGEGFVLRDTKKKEVGTFESEEEAWREARRLEREEFIKSGFTEQAANALMNFRTVADNQYHMLFESMSALIEEFEKRGEGIPQIAYRENGERVKVDLQVALAEMGNRRGYYMPRMRQPGQYKIFATKDGQQSRLEFRDTKVMANALAARLKRQGYTVEKSKAGKTPEVVFELAGNAISQQAMLDKALSRTGRPIIAELKDAGLKSKWVDNEDGGKDFLLIGEVKPAYENGLKDLGGESFYETKQQGRKRVGQNVWKFEGANESIEEDILSEIHAAEDMIGDPVLDMAEALVREVANIRKGRGSRSHTIKRSSALGDAVVIGYEEDPVLAITQSAAAIAGGQAKKVMAMNMTRQIMGRDISWNDYKAQMAETGERAIYSEYLKIVDERKIDPGQQPNAFKDATTLLKDMLRNDEAADRVIGALKGLAVLKYLSFRVAAPVVNLTALATSVPAAMSHYGGVNMTRSPRLLGRAMKRYWDYKRDPDSVDAKTRKIFDYIEEQGWHKAQYNKESMSVLQSKFGRAWSNVIEVGMIGFGVTEEINRVATLAGTAMGAMENGKSFEDAIKAAKEVSDKAHGTYGKANAPFLARGSNLASQIVRSAYVFRTFSHNYLLTMAEMGFSKEAAFMALSPTILAGAGASVLTPAIVKIFEAFGVDDPEEELYRLAGEFGGATGEAFTRNGLGGLAGVNLKGSLAINVLDLPTSFGDLAGAPGAVLSDLYQGGSQIMKGNVGKGLEKMAPLAIGNVGKAVREYTEGVTTRSNAPALYQGEPITADLYDAALRFFSFNPSSISTKREKSWSERKLKAKYAEARSDIYAKYKRWVLNGRNRKEAVKLVEEVQKYNKRAKAAGQTEITKKMIKNNLKRAFRGNK